MWNQHLGVKKRGSMQGLGPCELLFQQAFVSRSCCQAKVYWLVSKPPPEKCGSHVEHIILYIYMYKTIQLRIFLVQLGWVEVQSIFLQTEMMTLARDGWQQKWDQGSPLSTQYQVLHALYFHLFLPPFWDMYPPLCLVRHDLTIHLSQLSRTKGSV